MEVPLNQVIVLKFQNDYDFFTYSELVFLGQNSREITRI